MELKGIGVSPGIAVGEALVVEREAATAIRLLLPPEEVQGEVERLGEAVSASRRQLQAIRERLSQEAAAPHACIFEAHLLMLEDPLLLDRAVALVRSEHVNAAWALRTVSDELHARFEGLPDPYLRERSTDLEDVIGRILLNLRGASEAPSLSRLPGSYVIVAADLTPSEAADLDWERVLAVVIDAGSATYHTSILARSLGIPCVVGLEEATSRVPPGALVAVDGGRGLVVVEPSVPALDHYRATQERDRQEEQRLQATRALPAESRDGVRVHLRANAGFPDEAATALLYGAEGIGLFRSEYLLGRSRQWPSEDRQVEVYGRLLEQMRPHGVTVRLWDVGAGEFAPGAAPSPNPALGERALRLVLRNPEPYRLQVRALLRAGTRGGLRILLPFIAGPSDLDAALSLVDEARASLRRQGIECADDVPVGVNIEVPSAVLTADLLAPRVQFFGLGTNDLIQYLLAVDRVDPRVSGFYQPLHPAVLRSIRSVVEAAAVHDLPLVLCGEMAAEPLQALVAVGLGVRELSVTPSAIPRVKAAVRAAEVSFLREVTTSCLARSDVSEMESALRGILAGTAPAGDGETRA